ncbi:MAG: hypothetical protein CND43_04240 [Flavobacteriales bacterium MED-G15]|nr:MAG: hypothetical protein CND43_04240 [Flavobacteriales bacterium MED-G15]|tara:strand:- start:176 stop:388 length:213 start_codon:yes stop_codon:yes gene_type:complete
MNNLQRFPSAHINQAIVKTQNGAHWRQTLKSCCFSKGNFKLNAFHQSLKVKVHIDYPPLKQNTSQIKKKD